MPNDNLPAVMDFSIDAGAGLDPSESFETKPPFMKILQNASQAVVEGIANAGDFYISSTSQVFAGEEGITMIPCYRHRYYNIWTPRENGGGHQGTIEIDDPIVSEAKVLGWKKFLENGDELVETVDWYLLILGEEDMLTQCILPMTSTQLTASRKLVSLSNGLKLRDNNGNLFTPPLFSHMYKMTSLKTKNNKGSWFGLNVAVLGSITESSIYDSSKGFFESSRMSQQNLYLRSN